MAPIWTMPFLAGAAPPSDAQSSLVTVMLKGIVRGLAQRTQASVRSNIALGVLQQLRDADPRTEAVHWPTERRKGEALAPPSESFFRGHHQRVKLSGCQAELYSPHARAPQSPENAQVVLFFHAGGFTGGSVRQHRDLIQRIAELAHSSVLAVDYRLAPEHPYPAAIEDAVEAYHWLLREGYASHSIAVVGISAGGAIALALLQHLRGQNVAQPAAAWLLSPWLDLRLSAESLTSCIATDFCTIPSLTAQREAYRGSLAGDDPCLSPVLQTLQGLAPILVQCGGAEMLRDDSRLLHARMRQCGGACELEEYPGEFHAFQALAFVLPEAKRALERGCAWVMARTRDGARRELEIHSMPTLQEHWVWSNGAALHVVTGGPSEGRPVLLLHGFPECWWTFRHQVKALANAGFRVMAVDQRGFGESSCPSAVADYSKDLLAQDVAAVITHFGYQAASLVGHDWGGIVAWRFAQQYPAMLERLCVIDAPHPKVFAKHLKNPSQIARSGYVGLFQIPVLAEGLLSARGCALLEHALRSEVKQHERCNAQLAVYREQWLDPYRLQAMLAWYRAALRHRATATTEESISAPTLVLWGERDTALNYHMAAESSAECVNGRYMILQNTGHFATWEQPEAVNAALIEHLSPSDSRRNESQRTISDGPTETRSEP